MNTRFKSTLLCSLYAARGCLIAAAIVLAAANIAMVITAGFLNGYAFSYKGYAARTSGNAYYALYGNDVFTVITLFVIGFLLYERHKSFCNANSVSGVYRIATLGITIGGLCLVAAVTDTAVRELAAIKVSVSFSQALRIYVYGGFIGNEFPPCVAAESFFLYLSVFAAGYFAGAIRQKRSGLFLVLTLAAAGVLGYIGRAVAMCTAVNPIVWVFAFIPSLFFGNFFTAGIFYLLCTVLLMSGAYLISRSTVARAERGRRA